jgi:hypothetical protein
MWDQMLIAKHYPGKFDVPYVAGMNVTTANTGIVTSSFDISQAYADG